MKRIASLLMTIVLCCTIISCGNSISQEETALTAYNSLSKAHELLQEYDSDFYSVTEFASANKEPTIKNIAKNLNITEDELLEGFILFLKASFTEQFSEEDMNEKGIYLDDKEQMAEFAHLMLTDDSDTLVRYFRPFSFLIYAYEANGTIKEISELLAAGSEKIEVLEENFPDYEHLHELKEFHSELEAWSKLISKDTISDYVKFFTDDKSTEKASALAKDLKKSIT